MSPSGLRNADTEFRATDAVHLFWQDLTEAGSLKLREVLKYCTRGEAKLWEAKFDRDAFWTRSGQFIPFYVVDARVSPHRVHIHEPARVSHVRRFGKEVDERGRVARLVSHGETVVEGRGDDGTPFETARFTNYGFFMRRDARPARRRVKRLHPSLRLTPVPKRIIAVPTVADLRTPPAGWSEAPMRGRFGRVEDSDPRRWLLSDTDPNRHVHAMTYVAKAEEFAFQALGRREIPIERYYARAARVLFRKPCHTGEAYYRVGQFYRAPARDAFLFTGGFYPGVPGGEDGPGRPSTLVQLEIAVRPGVD